MNRQALVSRRAYLKGSTVAMLSAAGIARSGAAAATAQVKTDAAAGQSPKQPARQDLIDIGSARQLFCDERFIDAPERISIAMNPPAKLGPVLKPDRPWEDFRLTSYFTVVDDGKLARMYYSCFSHDQWNTPGAWDKHAYLCYAESTDGLHWDKPELGLVEFEGSKRNNILMPRIVDGTVFVDPTAPPQQRYKMLHTIGPHGVGLFVSCSADGIRFTTPDKPVSPWRPDSQQNAFYDQRLNKYVAYLRARPDMGLQPKGRSVARVEIDQIDQPWAGLTPQIVFAADDQDPDDVDFYTNACVKYPWGADAYFMFPATYHHFPKEYGNDGLLDSAAAFSRDGIVWQRPDRRPYVPLGMTDDWDAAFIMMGVGLVRRGKRIYQYYNGTDLSHGGTRKESKNVSKDRRRWGWMAAVQQRLDGFYCAQAAYEGGQFITPPIRFQGSRLVLNIDTSAAGSARVAITDASGAPIEGFAIDDCDKIMANDTDYEVSWRSRRDVSSLSGQPIRLRFQMRCARLYAMQFVT
ncbi:hypothetical protein [Fontivita pretiosa]|uniref:hypothetical protein n=1 Tax=Fontivita pretiosa TaxID=2989684 RepID=UPI003D17F30B